MHSSGTRYSFTKIMKSIIKKGKNAIKNQMEETDYDPNQPLVLKKCPSRKGAKCCNPRIAGMPRHHLMQFIEHWEQFLITKQLSAQAKGASFSMENHKKEIYTEEVQDIIFTDTNLERVMGLYNPQHDCFGIVVLQSLMVCPSFVNYVANKPAETNLDKVIRSFVAQYLSQSQQLCVSPILGEIFPLSTSRAQEDAEKFWEALATEYFDTDIAKVITTYTYVCVCGDVSIVTGRDNSLLLSWPDDRRPASMPTYISEMTRQTMNPMKIWRLCSKCGQGQCTMSVVYQLPKIFVINVCPYYYDSVNRRKPGENSERLLRQSSIVFHNEEDFSCLTGHRETAHYKVKGIVYYQNNGSNSGHYWARLFHGNESYNANDSTISDADDSDLRPNGRPYFAFYARMDTTMASMEQWFGNAPAETAECEESQVDDMDQPGPSTRF